MEGAYYANGCALYNLGRFAEAIEIFKTFAAQYPQSRYRDEALYRIAAAHQALEAYEPAVKAYADLVKQYPRSDYAEDALFQVGVCACCRTSGSGGGRVQGFHGVVSGSNRGRRRASPRGRSSTEEAGGRGGDAAVRRAEAADVNVVTYCNLLAFEIGDAAFDNTDYELALKAYRRVRTRRAVLRRSRRW